MCKYQKPGWILFVFLMNIGLSEAVLPPPSLGTVPFDHDKFLQFPESNRSDSIASANAYYAAVDPGNLRTTLNEWKTLNGFIEPLPNTTAGLAAMGISHALYRNATDLGFVRNVYLRVKANGDVVALLENFPSFERTLHRSANEAVDGCATPFNPALPAVQQCTSGGVDAFENRDLSGMLASVVMEYSAVTPGGPKFTQFYGYGNDGNRVAALDLTGRGKAEAFPALCAVCHGGNPGGIDSNWNFKPTDPAYADAKNGNFGAGFLPWDPDLYEYHDPLGAGVKVGSGVYSRANQEAFFKSLNQLVLLTNPTPAARELVEGFYGGPGMPGSFNSHYVPPGWTFTPEDTSFYQAVIAPYCRACHIQRSLPESTTNPNARTSQMDFNSSEDFYGLSNQLAATVLTRTTMPLALVTYKKFWSDSSAVTNFINYLEYTGYPQLIPAVAGVAEVPGKPVAVTGAYVNQVVGKPLTLDGNRSLSADNFSWSVSPTNGVTFINVSTATPTFTTTVPGVYTFTLTVSNNANPTTGRPAATSVPAAVTINVVGSGFSRVTFDAAITNSPNNERCLKCHSEPDVAGYEDFNFHSEMLKVAELGRYSFVNGNFTSRLLYKPAALLADVGVSDGVHNGGKILDEDEEYYSRLKNWIEDGECKNELGCQRISVTNENTALEIDPLTPFMDKSFTVTLSGAPAHGSLALTPGEKLLYTPDAGFTGLDSYRYLVTDLATGSARLVTDKMYVFPGLGNVTPNFIERFASQFSTAIPDVGSSYEFEKVNTDGDAVPNYMDDFPNNPFISRDTDGDGLPDDFNANVSDEDALASGIVIDTDDDNDGVPDVSDALPLDATASVYVDSDRDGIADTSDPFPNDMLGTNFENFETGNLGARPWVTSGNGAWNVVAPTGTPGHPLVGSFSARSPAMVDDESATLSVTLTVAAGNTSFWYFLSSESCCDYLSFAIDGVELSSLQQTSEWTKASFPVTAGSHTFTWTYSKDSSVSEGLDAALIDAIEFSGPEDLDVDGASNALDNCPGAKNSSQSDLDSDGIGDACDTGDFDGDGIADRDEVARGTNPGNSDTDGDGVNDGVDAFNLDPAASLDSDGDGAPDALVPGVASTSMPPLSVDLQPTNPRAGLDLDGDGVGDNAIYRVAGAFVNGVSTDGSLATDTYMYAQGIARDVAGNIFIADSSSRIFRVDAVTRIVTTIAGTGVYGFSGDGGLATAATMSTPTGLVLDAAGNLFFTDSGNNRIRRVDASTGIITTIAGTGVAGLSGDGGPATVADLNLGYMSGIALDAASNLYFVDQYNSRIRRIDKLTGLITTVAGTGLYVFNGDGILATDANLSYPTGIAFDAAGNLFVSDDGNSRVRRIDASTGIITTVAGKDFSGFNGDGGLAIDAELDGPAGLAFDAWGNLYITNQYNSRIRRIDTVTGIITTVAGSGSDVYSGDGGLATDAGLGYSTAVILDASGNLLITSEGKVRQITLVNPSDAFPYDPAASVDTDGDGYPDSYNLYATPAQVAASGLIIDAFPNDPTAAIDTDGDGLPDQFLVGSGINFPITLTEDLDDDGDGFSDAVEIQAGSDPLSNTSTPAILHDGDVNGDGQVNAADLLIALRILNGLYIPNPVELEHLDVAPLVGGIPAPDGNFDLGDYMVLLRKVTGQISY